MGREFILVYVDDLLILTYDAVQMEQVKYEVQSLFRMKYIGPVHYILRMAVTRNATIHKFGPSNSEMEGKCARQFDSVPSLLPASQLTRLDKLNSFSAF